MIPSVGRIVHYRMVEKVMPPVAAIITGCKGKGFPEHAESDFVVDLHIMYPGGQFDSLDVPYSETYEPGHWTWPPKV